MSSVVGQGEEWDFSFETHKEHRMRTTLQQIIDLTKRPGDPSDLLNSIRTCAALGLCKPKQVT